MEKHKVYHYLWCQVTRNENYKLINSLH